MQEQQPKTSLPDNAYRPLNEGEEYEPIMGAKDSPREVTPYSVSLGIIMAVIFSAAAAYLGLKVGQVFDGHISGMSEWGIFVELEDSIVEGMVAMRDIVGDYYRFDEARYEVYGHSTGNVFTLGDKVRVRVKSADLRRRMLDFTFADYEEEPELIIRDTVKKKRRK